MVKRDILKYNLIYIIMVGKEVRLSSGKTLQLNEFSLSSLKHNSAICMIAKRGSGKSWVCRSILKHFSYLPGGVIIAPTDKMTHFYGKFFQNCIFIMNTIVIFWNKCYTDKNK